MAKTQTLHKESIGLKVVIYIVCIILAILSLMPFFIMFTNATRSTAEIQSSAISLYCFNLHNDPCCLLLMPYFICSLRI